MTKYLTKELIFTILAIMFIALGGYYGAILNDYHSSSTAYCFAAIFAFYR